MRVWEVAVRADGEAAEAVSEVMGRFAPGGVAIETLLLPGDTDREYAAPETRVKVYLPVEDGAGRLRALQEALWHLGRIVELPEPEVRELAEEDWATAWQRDYHTLRLGRRLVIVPAWEEHDAAPADLVIRLEPGMAFGTGLHPTTRLCAAALEDTVRAGDRVLDVGTGSGILALAAARLGAAEVVGVEIDPVAVGAARENVARNGLTEHVRVVEGDAPPAGGWDVVVANILPATLLDMAEALAAAVAPGGSLILSGILDTHVAEVAAGFSAHGLALGEQRTEKDWTALTLRRAR